MPWQLNHFALLHCANFRSCAKRSSWRGWTCARLGRRLRGLPRRRSSALGRPQRRCVCVCMCVCVGWWCFPCSLFVRFPFHFPSHSFSPKIRQEKSTKETAYPPFVCVCVWVGGLVGWLSPFLKLCALFSFLFLFPFFFVPPIQHERLTKEADSRARKPQRRCVGGWLGYASC